MCYYVKETAPRFALFEADTEAVTWFSGEGSFRRHKSRAFGKTNQTTDTVLRCEAFRFFFLYTHRSLCVEHHITRNKDAVMFTNVTANTFQGQINAGFSKVCEIFKVHGIESLKYIREFHTPVCYCVNETNCDWLFDMSFKRPHGRALANECGHLFQTFGCQSEGLATRD